MRCPNCELGYICNNCGVCDNCKFDIEEEKQDE